MLLARLDDNAVADRGINTLAVNGENRRSRRRNVKHFRQISVVMP